MGFAKKVDLNHSEIVRSLRGLGFSVLDTSRLGKDAPDLFVAFNGATIAVEVKSKAGKLTSGQDKWLKEWTGISCVARCAEDVYKCIREVLTCTR